MENPQPAEEKVSGTTQKMPRPRWLLPALVALILVLGLSLVMIFIHIFYVIIRW